MSDRDEQLPERMRAAGATKLEQRLLDAAARERPTRSATERMARALGVAPPIMSGAEGAPGGQATAPAPAAAASGGAVPWISGAIVAMAVGGALMALTSETTRDGGQSSPVAVVVTPQTPPAASSTATVPPASTATPAPAAATARRPRASASAGTGDLSEQIALLDAARAQMHAARYERALDTLRRYLSKYPTGSFRPEATALEIESLAKLGRGAESRTLADRFVAEHQGTPLAKRVKELTKPAPSRDGARQ